MIGNTVSHYRIESELGRGGMGVVYKAQDLSLDRIVALKFLPPTAAVGESDEARFVNEAKAVSALDHPNIAVVHEIDRTDDGHLFIVMGYYDGQTLESRIAEGEIELSEAVEIATQMASGLGTAHEKGIIHRDVKPGNVMLTSRGMVKILDFGLAKVQNANLTIGAQSLGTLSYMSPEQAQGADLDHRTDLWALGVVLYEMITGRRPFEAPYDAAILYSALNEPHEPVQTYRPDVPEYLGTLVDHLLQKDPARRPGSASEVISGLHGEVSVSPASPIVESSPDNGSSASSSEPIERPSTAPAQNSVVISLDTDSFKKNRWIILGLAVCVVVALSIAYTLAWRTDSSDGNRLAAREHVEKGMEHQANREYSLAEAEYQRAVERDPELWSAWTSYASLKNTLGEHDTAIEYAEQAIRLNENDAAAHFNLGSALADSGRPQDALEAFSAAVRVDGLFTAAYSAWGNTLVALEQFSTAVDVLQRGLEATPDDPHVYLIYRNLGSAYAGLDNIDDAILYLESSLLLQPDQLPVIEQLARLYERHGDTAEAISYWRQYESLSVDPREVRRAQNAINRLEG